MPELASTWPGRLRQAVVYAAARPLLRVSVATGRALMRPTSVAFYLGPRCNLTCRHCGYYGDGPPVGFEDYTRVLAETWRLGARELTLTGGEPTLIRDFPRYLGHAISTGWITGFTTNGTTLRGPLVADLMKTGVQRVSISLDGLEQAHDIVRGEGVFTRAMEGLANLLSAREAHPRLELRVNMVLLRHNLTDVLALHDWCAARRVWFNVMPYTSENLAYHQQEVGQDFAPDTAAREQLTTLMPHWLRARRQKGYWLNTSRHLKEIQHFVDTGQRRGQCLVGAYQFNVDEKLRVGFCTEAIGVIGDLNQQSAHEIWRSPQAAAARQKTGRCRDCVLNCYYSPSLAEGAFDLLPVLLKSR